jgi:signal transduction histidine kinase
MLDVARPRMLVRALNDGRRNRLHVSDLGTGMDLHGQARLFEPFNREQRTSEERAALGLGGMGLGLTIVRMIADQRGCNARFVEPDAGWSTTFELEWTPRSDENTDL